MQAYLRAEFLKTKRTFTRKLTWLAPLLTLLLCTGLMAGPFFQIASYNWWYTLLLPGALTLMCTGVIQKDSKKLKYRAIFGLPVSLSKVWLGKIGVIAGLLLASSVILMLGVALSGLVFPAGLTLADHALASLLLFLTFLWQIPLCLFLTDRVGMFATMILNVLGNIACNILFATTAFWWAVPYAIPSRLMCATIGVLPNGLPVPEGDALWDKSVILPGVLITLGLFFLLCILTMRSFRHREDK
ncbi:lantibiotic immunity ABC transporter MutE/EpiE family permease subunit [Paenibacillus sp. p3-SID1389]|uniref:lantibiotic immunity ABC transporter MutE/EpiE family permease subunit n=1 Tax=Paenibacillus sp. p3-SID1389 TaxID=2916364 RepID=UPI0021A2B1EB|nr:lantibiotic immunity ABC transporter MutE/EpiE family permease subunit [Paenibacillus sp. p3-SID1389]MCT2194728.1 lantibiotic immunity ABC transporter MutE/EpiE family permease subunit [Paenibacillus sp. p3-SID1389]